MEENFEKPNTGNSKRWKITYEEVPEKEGTEEYKNTKELLLEMIPGRMVDVLKGKILDYVISHPEDTFHLKDTVELILNSDINIGGPKTFNFEIEIEGEEKDLFELYRKTLEENISKLNLNSEKLYAIYHCSPEFEFFGQETDESGKKKEVWFSSFTIDRSRK